MVIKMIDGSQSNLSDAGKENLGKVNASRSEITALVLSLLSAVAMFFVMYEGL